MEFRPTFFSISGFLIPGIIFFTAVLVVFEPSRVWLFQQGSPLVASPEEGKAVGIPLAVSLLGVALSVCFVFGTVISETFLIAVIFGVRRLLFHTNTHEYSKKLFAYTSLKDLLTHDLDARETFAYQQTCGVDLHWFAGRNRMLGGSGLSCLAAAILAFSVGAPHVQAWSLLAFALVAMSIAAYRIKRFEEYVTVTAATAYLSPISLRRKALEDRLARIGEGEVN